MPNDRPPLRVGVLVSGEGTNLQNLIDRIADGRLPGVCLAVVIASRSRIGGVDRAKAAGLPLDVIRVKDHAGVEEFSEHLAVTLDDYAVDLAVQAGWLCYWRPPRRWAGRVINLHPALLPKFGGKGFYGQRVHEAVLAAGEAESGATVHWVDEEYDHGEHIAQRRCKVIPGEGAATLARRVREIEFELLPEVIAAIAAGRIPLPSTGHRRR
jgi:phosphoribosylglycinamide formyltransferase-1